MAKKSGADGVQAAAIGHNGSSLKSILMQLTKLKQEEDDLKGRRAQIFNAGEDQGFDRKLVKIILKERMKPLSAQLKAEINEAREMLDELPLFNPALARKDEQHSEDEAA